MTLLRMSLIGAGMIGMITLLRLLLQRRVHRSVFLTLWAIAALRLLVPMFIPTGVQIALPAQSEQNFAATAVRSIVQPTELTPVQSNASLLRLLPWVWMAVAAALLIGFAVSHVRLRRSFRFSVPMPEQAGVAANVRMLDGLASPLTYGVLRPVILLPADFDWHDGQKLTQVLAHERTHIRHRDVLFKGLLLTVCCVHWFNPAVWLMLYLASQDMEMRCDAAVVRALGKGGKVQYARTLVETERDRTFGGVLQTGFSVNSTAKRLKALAKAKVRPALSVMLGIVTVVMACMGFLTVSAAAEKVDIPRLTTKKMTEPATQQETAKEDNRPEQTQPVTAVERTEDNEADASEPTEPERPEEPADAVHISAIPSSVTPGTMLYVTLTGDTAARLVSDQPSVLAIECYSEAIDGTLEYTLCAYGSGTANLYCDNGSGSMLVATVTVQATAVDEDRKASFLGEDYQPQIDINPNNGPAGDLSWLLNGEEDTP